jgi:predicted  nucleic acid-binding Zn-ribbon protein
MRDQLRALARLSEIDASAGDIDQELKDIPARIADMRADVEKLEAMLQRERQELEDAERLGRQHE